MKRLALALAAMSNLVLFAPTSEARPFGGSHGFHHAGHHAGFGVLRGARHGIHGYRPVGFRSHHRRFRGYRSVGFRSAYFGNRRHYRPYGYHRGYGGLGLAAAAIRPAYYGASYGRPYGYGYGYRYAPVSYGYGYGARRPYYGCGY